MLTMILRDGTNNQLTLTVHSAVTHMTYKHDLVAAKAWDYILFCIYPKLKTQERFFIPLDDLLKYLGIKTRNYKYIKSFLQDLRREEIEFNILGKDTASEWISCSLLATAGISNGNIIIELPPFLREQILRHKHMFVRLNLLILREFKSKYGYALYKVLCDYLISGQEVTQKIIAIEKLRQLFDIDPNSYPTFKDFNRYVVKKAVKEINEVSNIEVEVSSVCKEGSKKVIALRFSASLKSPVPDVLCDNPSIEGDELISEFNEVPQITHSLPPSIVVDQEVIDTLLAIEFSWHPSAKKRAKELKEIFTQEEFDSYMLYLSKEALKQEKVNRSNGVPDDKNSPGGLCFHLMKDNSNIPIFRAYLAKQEEKAVKDKLKAEREQELLVSRMKEQLEKLHNDKDRQRFSQWIQSSDDEILESLKELSKKHIELRLVLGNGFTRETLVQGSKVGTVYKFSNELGFDKEPFDLEMYLNHPDYDKERKEALMKAQQSD